jgi:hypothetical protein
MYEKIKIVEGDKVITIIEKTKSKNQIIGCAGRFFRGGQNASDP